MATTYTNPILAPSFFGADGEFDRAGYENRCEQYRADTLGFIKNKLGGKGKYVGKVIGFRVADGYAQYMVWTLTKWVHLDEGDGWSADPATIRGTRARDVVEMIEREERQKELFLQWKGTSP